MAQHCMAWKRYGRGNLMHYYPDYALCFGVSGWGGGMQEPASLESSKGGSIFALGSPDPSEGLRKDAQRTGGKGGDSLRGFSILASCKDAWTATPILPSAPDLIQLGIMGVASPAPGGRKMGRMPGRLPADKGGRCR